MITTFYFDMDGVLCNLEKSFVQCTSISIDKFQKFSKEEKDKIKQEVFTYDFFRSFEPHIKMVNAAMSAMREGIPTKILTATGHINVDQVKAAKREWILKHLGDVEIIFVDKVQNKGSILHGLTDHHHLYDDRQAAIDSWLKMDDAHPGLIATATLVTM